MDRLYERNAFIQIFPMSFYMYKERMIWAIEVDCIMDGGGCIDLCGFGDSYYTANGTMTTTA